MRFREKILERERKRKKTLNAIQMIPILAFFITLIFLSLVCVFKKDAEISEKEKRTLEQRPTFSLKSYFNGTFTRKFTDYFSDQFAFRDFFLNKNKKIMAFYTGTNKDGMEIVDIKKPDYGVGESLNPIVDTTSNTISVDTTYVDTTNTTINTTEEEIKKLPPPKEVEDVNSILIADNRAMEYFGINEDSLLAYANSINILQENTPSAKVYNLIVPTSFEFYSPEDYHSGNHSEKKAIKIIYDALKNVISVDAYSKIAPHIDEYLYFKTDHHWTARGAYYAYKAFAKSAGFDPVNIDELKTGQLDGFIGSLYSYTLSQKLYDNPDFVEYFLPKNSSSCIVYQDPSMQEGYPIDLITTNIQSSNKYLAFITGDTPLLHIKSEVKNGKKLLVTKESYGNALIPFLVDNYEDIYIIDPRQIYMSIPKFITDNDIKEILCINSIFVPSNPIWMNSFNNCIY